MTLGKIVLDGKTIPYVSSIGWIIPSAQRERRPEPINETLSFSTINRFWQTAIRITTEVIGW
jgi:hypothetical protein